MENTEVDVLLVEDNMYDAEVTIRALRKTKVTIKIIHAKDGSEALAFLFGTGEYEHNNIVIKPSVILLDLNMPRLNGKEFLTMIKANDLTKRIPVVVLTSSEGDRDRCFSMGATNYIVKPVETDSYTRTVIKLGLYWLVENHITGSLHDPILK